MNPKISKFYNNFKKITQAQKKIIYLGIIALLFLLFFWIFIYKPESRRLMVLKEKLNQTEAQIAEIVSIAKGRDLTEAIRKLRLDFAKITSKFPAEDEVVIYNLSENAKKLKIEVRNIIPSDKQLLENKISGYNIEELPISMNLTSEFRALGEYLNILRNSLPALIRIRQLDIKGKGEGRTDLEVNLQISAYLLKVK